MEEVEYGFRSKHTKLHQSEAMILHFTDGSSLGIDTGSNVVNLSHDYGELDPQEFHSISFSGGSRHPARATRPTSRAPQRGSQRNVRRDVPCETGSLPQNRSSAVGVGGGRC